MPTRRLWLLLLVLLLAGALAVVARWRVTSSPPDSTAPITLRTFHVFTTGGTPVPCPAWGAKDPVYGHLAGDPRNSAEAVWLVDPAGAHLSIVWPEGFTVRFEPGAVLRDASGRVVARAGDAFELQVDRSWAKGTRADPYFASGLLVAGEFTANDMSTGVNYNGCFPREGGYPP